MKFKYLALAITGVALVTLAALWGFKGFLNQPRLSIGAKVDSLNGVYVYHNGNVGNVTGRNVTADGYNLGLKYQCVEFVKRYYYQRLNHKMPNSYGHAKDFFDKRYSDGQRNKERGLNQYTNPSKSKPKVNDLVIFAPTTFNRFGHVAIVAGVGDRSIEIIQQNAGPFKKAREVIGIAKRNGRWEIGDQKVLGWLRKG